MYSPHDAFQNFAREQINAITGKLDGKLVALGDDDLPPTAESAFDPEEGRVDVEYDPRQVTPVRFTERPKKNERRLVISGLFAEMYNPFGERELSPDDEQLLEALSGGLVHHILHAHLSRHDGTHEHTEAFHELENQIRQELFHLPETDNWYADHKQRAPDYYQWVRGLPNQVDGEQLAEDREFRQKQADNRRKNIKAAKGLRRLRDALGDDEEGLEATG